jgi:hypothetical protein
VVNRTNGVEKNLEGPYMLPEKTKTEAENLCDQFATNYIERNPLTNNLDRVEGKLEDLGTRVPSIPPED